MALCHAPYDGIIRIRSRVWETAIPLSADFCVSSPVVFFCHYSTSNG